MRTHSDACVRKTVTSCKDAYAPNVVRTHDGNFAQLCIRTVGRAYGRVHAREVINCKSLGAIFGPLKPNPTHF
ncbi:uncharacterized protein DS421_12g368530 [Arachis hypogaea]|nr:uncharacterized protein DS421_12g368530 [Arachis hypogaea]